MGGTDQLPDGAVDHDVLPLLECGFAEAIFFATQWSTADFEIFRSFATSDSLLPAASSAWTLWQVDCFLVAAAGLTTSRLAAKNGTAAIMMRFIRLTSFFGSTLAADLWCQQGRYQRPARFDRALARRSPAHPEAACHGRVRHMVPPARPTRRRCA